MQIDFFELKQIIQAYTKTAPGRPAFEPDYKAYLKNKNSKTFPGNLKNFIRYSEN